MTELQPPTDRTVLRTFHGHAQPDIFVTVDEVEHRGELRAWSVDNDGTWWAHVQWHDTPGVTRLGIVHESQLRPDSDLGEGLPADLSS